MRMLEGCDDRALVARRVWLLAVLAALALPGLGRAADYCVNSPPGCVGTPETNLQTALFAAGATTTIPDRVFVGPGTYDDMDGFVYLGVEPANPVEVIGVGTPRPTLTMTTAGPNYVLSLLHPDSAISNFEIVIPNVDLTKGLLLAGGTAGNVSISSVDSPAIRQTGVEIGSAGGVIEDSAIAIGAGSLGTFGVDINTTAPAAVRDTTIEALLGMRASSQGATTTISRDRISGTVGGIVIGTGDVAIDNSLIDLRGGNPSLLSETGVSVGATNSAPTTTVDAHQLTIRNGGSDSIGVGVYADNTVENVTVDLRNSIVRDHPTAIDLQTFANLGSVTVNSSNNNYDQGTTNTSGSGTETLNQSGIVNFDPLFRTELFGASGLDGDYRLRYDSQLIDAGATIALGSGELDLKGAPRIVDGASPFSGAVRDIGAFEYQPTPPLAVASATPVTAVAGKEIEFGSGGSSDPDNDPLSFGWEFDDGGTATGATAKHAFGKAGKHTATLTVTDASGQSATDTVEVTIKDVTAPKQKLSGAKTQDIDDLALRDRLNEAGTIVAKGTVRLPSAATKTVRFKRVRKSAAKGKKVKLRFKLAKKPRAAVKKLIAGGANPKAKLSVKAIDKAGNASVEKLTVKLED